MSGTERILSPLGVARDDAWITDCLTTYRAPVKMRAAVENVYEPFAHAHALPPAELAPHPSEAQIVSEGIDQNLARLRRELTAAPPDLIVTLGNASLRVLQKLLGGVAAPTKLTVADSHRSAGEPQRACDELATSRTQQRQGRPKWHTKRG